jgi:hypothetical protein
VPHCQEPTDTEMRMSHILWELPASFRPDARGILQIAVHNPTLSPKSLTLRPERFSPPRRYRMKNTVASPYNVGLMFHKLKFPNGSQVIVAGVAAASPWLLRDRRFHLGAAVHERFLP